MMDVNTKGQSLSGCKHLRNLTSLSVDGVMLLYLMEGTTMKFIETRIETKLFEVYNDSDLKSKPYFLHDIC